MAACEATYSSVISWIVLEVPCWSDCSGSGCEDTSAVGRDDDGRQIGIVLWFRDRLRGTTISSSLDICGATSSGVPSVHTSCGIPEQQHMLTGTTSASQSGMKLKEQGVRWSIPVWDELVQFKTCMKSSCHYKSDCFPCVWDHPSLG